MLAAAVADAASMPGSVATASKYSARLVRNSSSPCRSSASGAKVPARKASRRASSSGDMLARRIAGNVSRQAGIPSMRSRSNASSARSADASCSRHSATASESAAPSARPAIISLNSERNSCSSSRSSSFSDCAPARIRTSRNSARNSGPSSCCCSTTSISGVEKFSCCRNSPSLPSTRRCFRSPGSSSASSRNASNSSRNSSALSSAPGWAIRRAPSSVPAGIASKRETS